MRDIFEFNHIDKTLSEEKVKFLKDLYTHYHKKHYCYEKLHLGFRRKNFVCNLSAGKLIISAAVAGGITLNPAVMATLTGVGLILKAVASLKKFNKKMERANSWTNRLKLFDNTDVGDGVVDLKNVIVLNVGIKRWDRYYHSKSALLEKDFNNSIEFFYNSDMTGYYTYFSTVPSDWDMSCIIEWLRIPQPI